MIEFLTIVAIAAGLVTLWTYIRLIQFRMQSAEREAKYWKQKYRERALR